MKRFAARTFWIGLLLLMAALTCRLVWLASQTETGVELLTSKWADATLGLVVDRRPVHARHPTEQAEFWLREVDRVIARHPHDAELAMGAAQVLNQPDYGEVRGFVENMEYHGVCGRRS